MEKVGSERDELCRIGWDRDGSERDEPRRIGSERGKDWIRKR